MVLQRGLGRVAIDLMVSDTVRRGDLMSVIPSWREQPTIGIPEAGALLGLRRSASYRAAKLGHIGPIVELGQRRRVVATKPFLESLGLADPATRDEVHLEQGGPR